MIKRVNLERTAVARIHLVVINAGTGTVQLQTNNGGGAMMLKANSWRAGRGSNGITRFAMVGGFVDSLSPVPCNETFQHQ